MKIGKDGQIVRGTGYGRNDKHKRGKTSGEKEEESTRNRSFFLSKSSRMTRSFGFDNGLSVRIRKKGRSL